MKKTVIIGGGPSGILTGIFASNRNQQVILLERNPIILKKLLLTGSGKCNFFNEVYNPSCYSSEDMDQVERLLSSYYLQNVRDFFDSIGLVSQVRNGHYYPYTFQASTMEKLLREEAIHKGVEIRTNSCVTKIVKKKKMFYVTCNDEVITCDNLVLACGSKAFPKTGSDGMGYQFLRKFSHKIVPPVPALVQLEGEEKYFKDWDGVRAEVRVSLYEDNEFKASEEGEIQLTSYGLSGICIFNLSHLVSRGLRNKHQEEIRINFVPFVDIPVLSFLDDYASRNSYKNTLELLEGFLNTKLANVILERSFINPYEFYKNLNNDKKSLLAKNLESFAVPIIDTKGFTSSQICAGGVRLNEINIDTMESKLVPHLYVVGELLDMNGKCGGYNLTLCWISGMLAGKSIGGQDD